MNALNKLILYIGIVCVVTFMLVLIVNALDKRFRKSDTSQTSLKELMKGKKDDDNSDAS